MVWAGLPGSGASGRKLDEYRPVKPEGAPDRVCGEFPIKRQSGCEIDRGNVAANARVGAVTGGRVRYHASPTIASLGGNASHPMNLPLVCSIFDPVDLPVEVEVRVVFGHGEA